MRAVSHELRGAGMSRVERIGDATLYLGDCREILPGIGKVDAVFMDPPYGVNGSQNTKTAQRRGGRKNDYASFVDSVDYVASVAVVAAEMCLTICSRMVVTPGNRCLTLYPEPDSFGAIYQPASVGLQPWGRADAQPILYYGKSPYGGTQLPGKRCSFVLTESAEANGHPCPKPIGLIKSIISNTTLVHEQVLDPFMGSGTTGVACAKLGRKFIGIEIEPKYFDIACRRIEQAYKQPDLFITKPAPAIQDALL
jgi:site-specific DNA-methyltransferase (adenine-specific)